jgi:NAD(P)H-nitrite reductase large subunit
VHADAVILATGARERPRPARLIPGDRPDGVYTTGQLQNLVHLHDARVGTRAVVVGAELVSWSAVLTLREAGCATVAMTSHYPRSEAYAAFRIPGRFLLRGPVLTRTRLVSIAGRDRVSEVVVEHLDTGERTTIDCDTVVTTGDWIPDHELARSAGLAMDPATRGPIVDAGLRTSRLGVFAVGNLLHPVDTADGAALDGRHVAPKVSDWLRTGSQGATGIRVRARAPFRWVTPQLITPDGGISPRGDLLLWVDEYHRVPRLHAVQNGRVIAHRRTPWPAAPGRIYRAPWALVAGADPAGGDVTIELAD